MNFGNCSNSLGQVGSQPNREVARRTEVRSRPFCCALTARPQQTLLPPGPGRSPCTGKLADALGSWRTWLLPGASLWGPPCSSVAVNPFFGGTHLGDEFPQHRPPGPPVASQSVLPQDFPPAHTGTPTYPTPYCSHLSPERRPTELGPEGCTRSASPRGPQARPIQRPKTGQVALLPRGLNLLHLRDSRAGSWQPLLVDPPALSSHPPRHSVLAVFPPDFSLPLKPWPLPHVYCLCSPPRAPVRLLTGLRSQALALLLHPGGAEERQKAEYGPAAVWTSG